MKKKRQRFTDYNSGKRVAESKRCTTTASCDCCPRGVHKCAKKRGHTGMCTTMFWPSHFVG